MSNLSSKSKVTDNSIQKIANEHDQIIAQHNKILADQYQLVKEHRQTYNSNNKYLSFEELIV